METQDVFTLAPRKLAALAAEPLVSVLLANYNYAGFIAESIDSVLAQTYRNWELIVCDDGSTDDSVSVIARYAAADPRIKMICRPNGGHTAALNTAFAQCRGEIVCFLDSDDLFLPEKLASVVRAYSLDSSAGMVAHRVIRVNERRQKQGVWPLSDVPDGWLCPELLKGGGVLSYAPPTSGIALRREIADSLFPISTDPPLHMCPDQVITRLAPLMSCVRRLPASLAEYRVHSSNTYSRQGVSAQAAKQQLDISRALWREQRRFLSSLHPEAAAQLADIEDNALTALLEYQQAKLQNNALAPAYLKRYLALCQAQGGSTLIAFWRVSRYLPNFVFRPAVNLLTGQGVLKQLVSRLKRLS